MSKECLKLSKDFKKNSHQQQNYKFPFSLCIYTSKIQPSKTTFNTSLNTPQPMDNFVVHNYKNKTVNVDNRQADSKIIAQLGLRQKALNPKIFNNPLQVKIKTTNPNHFLVTNTGEPRQRRGGCRLVHGLRRPSRRSAKP